MVLELEHPEFGMVREVAGSIKVSDYKAEHRRGPSLGEHTEEMLKTELALSSEEIVELRTNGVI